MSSRYTETSMDAIDPLETMPPAKKSMVIFFLVDTSKSMEGTKLESLNKVMGDILPELIGVGEAGTDVKIAIMAFSSGFEWITPEPVLIEEYQRWENLQAGGVTDLGEACEELSRKLSRKSFLPSPSLSYAPVIFLITDGYPTDNYKKGFDMLKKNRWFHYALKIALAIGSNVDMDVLHEFTDDEELVLQAVGADMLKKLVREIAVTSSKIGSTSMTLTEAGGERAMEDVAGAKKEQMIEAVQEMKQDIFEVEDLTDLDDLDIEFDEGW
ncbi:MAG: VWA domain-containing protein [Clostridiales bacterium]|nr:VWA domain-containing protein [Clostridiales bacterium]